MDKATLEKLAIADANANNVEGAFLRGMWIDRYIRNHS